MDTTHTSPTPPPHAPLWRRLGAFLLDLLLLGPLLFGLGTAWQRLFAIALPSGRLPLFDWLVQLSLQHDPLVIGGVLFLGFAASAYFFVGHLLWGTTVGMRLLRLRVVDDRARIPSPAAVTARTLGAALSLAYLGLGFAWILFDAHRQGFHDKIAGTYVVRVNTR